jgi:hypothetical protein
MSFFFDEWSYDVQLIQKTLNIALNTKKSNTKKSSASLELLLTLMERDSYVLVYVITLQTFNI